MTEDPPHPGAKTCFVIPSDQWEDSDRVAKLARIMMAELPAVEVKKQRMT